MGLPMNAAGSTSARTLHVSDQQVADFLHATNPCYANLPTEMRDGVREYLQRQADNGELTEHHLNEYSRVASTLRAVED